MSKEMFSEKVVGLMYSKAKDLEYGALSLFKEDKSFEFILSIAYLTLSKEKIIDKDIKNGDKLGRLSLSVDRTYIDKVFTSGFSDKMPIITEAEENDNVWILDNIRDSIMHGQFDIDEEKEEITINNNMPGRKLVATIPFEWIIKYSREEIAKQRETDSLKFSNFFYDKRKTNKKYIVTEKEALYSILYDIRITGDTFNINDVRKDVIGKLKEYSEQDIPEDQKEEYRIKAESYKGWLFYDKEYLAQYYYVCDKLHKYFDKEYPGLKLGIFINNNKNNIVYHKTKMLQEYYTNYDLAFDMLNGLISIRSDRMLDTLSKILTNIGNISYEDAMTHRRELSFGPDIDFMKYINRLLSDDDIKYDTRQDVKHRYKENLKLIRSVLFNSMGIASLVINHETLYNQAFLNKNPRDFNLTASSTQLYVDYANEKKRLLMSILDLDILISERTKQRDNCRDDEVKAKLQAKIDELENERAILTEKVDTLEMDRNFESRIDRSFYNQENESAILSRIDRMLYHFANTTNKNDKKKIKKMISELYDVYIEESSKYTQGYCNNMEEALTIIRNSFSHIGRVHMGKDREEDTVVVFNDYDTDGKKSGVVFANYRNFMNLLFTPFHGDRGRK